MSTNKTRQLVIVMALALLGGLLLSIPGRAKAGIFEARNEVTYKEYWVHHNQFTGGCNEDGTPTHPYGTFYFEPHTLAKCPKTVTFTLPDDFSNAAKIEVYLDLWRNYTIQAATFKINGGSTIYHPPVGNDWSRSPYVMEIDKSEFQQGQNTMTFWGEKKYHVHDIGIRIYYTNDNPLVPGQGSDVEPPNGQLTSIADDNGPVGPNAGGTLMVNDNELTLTADISADTAYVEFHAWYEGYDEDNDTVFRDWHNLGRNNWWPGGTEAKPTGGVINHIGTVDPKPNVTTATVVWDVSHITNQSLIKFKIRVVDTAGNVREAPGGESADFKLMRSGPATSFIMHDFVDTSLHMDGSRPDSVTYTFAMPTSVTDFTTAYLVGAYWRNPNFSINFNSMGTVGANDWSLGIKSFNKNTLVAGNNKITYLYTSGIGQFIEQPGPMFVLRRTTAIADTAAPAVSKQNPLPNATDVDVKLPIIAHVGDLLYGVDWKTVVMRLNGADVTNKAELRGTMGDYRLYYKQGNLDYATEYTVEIEACDLLGNCMQTVNYKFTTAAPDTTPPDIDNIVIVPLPIGANVTWTTNEPATSRIDYGKTQGYELGVVEDTTLKTNHSLEIRGLQPDTQYHLRIKGTDEQGNTGQSGNQSFTTLEFGSLLSDDFNSCVLDESIWTVVNPNNDATWFMDGQKFRLSVPAGVSHDFPGTGATAARLMQAGGSGDFGLEVKFDSVIGTVGQMQGILIEEDAGTYIRISYEMSPTKGPIMFAAFVVDGVMVKGVTREFNLLVPPQTVPPAYMRVTRTGDEWAWYWSQNGTNWQRANLPYSLSLSVLNAGVFSGNTGAAGTQPAQNTLVDYFFNSAAPIVPEDATPMNINLTQVGTGTVTKLPDKSPYTCGEEVVLSATTIPGWSFAGWSGDLNSTTPTAAVTIDAPKYITATFTQDQYLLNIVIDNEGVGGESNTVSKSPDQATYVYGDVVQLTAVAQPGWTFVEWGGAVTGTDPTAQITMNKTETVTARFEQDQYDLDVNIVHNGIGAGGTISLSPLKSTYLYGDVVTLTADLNPGWTFGGWSGGVTSPDLETQITITGDTAITATFNQIQYYINVDVVGGGGEVRLDPEQAFYLYGDQVGLIADGGDCFTFDRWEGDLSGNNPVEIVTITDDLDISAIFVQNEYTLTVNKVGPGNVAISPNLAEYKCGQEVTLNAIPAADNFFAGWSGDQVGAENPLTFAVTKNMVVTATFTNNPPPVVTPIGDQTTLVGQLVTFNVEATDSAGETLVLSAEGLPDGATFEDNGDGTGVFTWRPSVTQTGEFTVTFIATDGTGQGSTTVTITVEGTATVLPMIIGG